MTVRRVRSGSPYESAFGFVRALRVGARVLLAGTAPIRPDGSVDDGAAAQMHRCVDIAQDALAEVGAGLRDVVRTRMFLVDADDAEEVGRVHGERFGASPPVATMVVVAGLLDPRWRIEVEFEAVLDGDGG